MTYDRPITIQRIDEETEQWTDAWHLHARVNKTTGSEFVEAGAVQSQSTKTFDFRYFPEVENVDCSRGLYRIVYRGNFYNIVDYDDYMQKHQTVRLKGVSY